MLWILRPTDQVLIQNSLIWSLQMEVKKKLAQFMILKTNKKTIIRSKIGFVADRRWYLKYP